MLTNTCMIIAKLKLLKILSFRLTTSGQEVFITVIWVFKIPEKVECVDGNWRISAVLVILNCTKICTKISSYCCYVVLYLKHLFSMGLLICVGSAKNNYNKSL